MKDILDYEEPRKFSNFKQYLKLYHLLFIFLAVSFGFLTRLARPYALSNSTHYEAVFALYVLIFFSILTLPKFTRKINIDYRKSEFIKFTINLSIIWIGFISGWLFAHQQLFGIAIDFSIVILGFYFVALIIGLTFIYFKVRLQF